MHPCEHARVHAPNLLPRARDDPHDLLALPPHVGSGARAIFPERDRAPASATVRQPAHLWAGGRRGNCAVGGAPQRAGLHAAQRRGVRASPFPPGFAWEVRVSTRARQSLRAVRERARARARVRAHGLSCALCALEHWAPEAAAGGRDPPAARPLDDGENLYAMRARDDAVALCARRPGFPRGFPDHRHGAHCGFACAR